MPKRNPMLFAALMALATPALSASDAPPAPADFRARLPEDEIIYFVLPDRFDNGDPRNDKGDFGGDRLTHGYDPTAKGFFHGGDLKGLIRRLDYIQGLGATAIWVGPIFRNKPVQGAKGQESAGYHGYWITDFTHVDPHFGTDADFAALVKAAHGRGMKVYMDIIANHTADVIQYRECAVSACTYRSRADYPYQRRGGVTGQPINPGFTSDDDHRPDNFARLADPSYAYTPYIPKGEEQTKTPAWLNDVTLYHNRGETTYRGESATMGDFVGLDDLMTENPRVIAGMIEIFGDWIDRFGVDGFRVDTARHVDPHFWQAFVPAMQARAKAKGIPNFHIFGEVSESDILSGPLAWHTREGGFPSVLDFAFHQVAIQTVAGKGATALWEKMLQGDALYVQGEATARQLPTFISNHDNGRFATFVRRAFPAASEQEVLDRVTLGHAMMLTLRGAPTLYYGDEQGFSGDGGDQDAREDMFGSKVAIYNDNRLVGTDATTATPRFDPSHSLYRTIASLARLRTAHPALRRGKQVVRARSEEPGLFALSRFDPDTGAEYLIAFNTSTAPIQTHVQVDARSDAFATLAGAPCAGRAAAPGSLAVTLPPLGYSLCAVRAPSSPSAKSPE